MESDISAPKMQSEKIGALAAALAMAQGEIVPAVEDGDNPHFGSKFATLALKFLSSGERSKARFR